MIKEEWKIYVHADNNKEYHISNFAKVKSKVSGKTNELYTHKIYKNNGYRCIPYRKSNKKNGLIYLHKIMTKLWVDNPNQYKNIKFINGDSSNCMAHNLKWISKEEAKEMNQQRTKPYDIYPNFAPNSKLSLSRVSVIKKRALQNEKTKKTKWTTMAKQFGINYRHLWMIRKGLIWKNIDPTK